MANFLKKVIPFSTEVVTWLNNRFAYKSHGSHYTKEEIKAMIGDVASTTFGSMPDYSRASLLFKWNSSNHTNMPIHKINVPGYILISAGYASNNQDSVIAIASSPTILQTTDNSTNRYISLQGTASDSTSGGAIMAPIMPGTSTYFTGFGSVVTYYIIFIPCVSVPQTVPITSMCPYSGYNQLQTVQGELPAAPGSDAWINTFSGDWSDNI